MRILTRMNSEFRENVRFTIIDLTKELQKWSTATLLEIDGS